MSQKNNSQPFEPLMNSLKDSFGMSDGEALLVIQKRLDDFIDSKTDQIVRFDIESNDVAKRSTAGLTTLATVLIPLVGIMFAQTDILNQLSDIQKIFVITILLTLFLSIVFGVISYMSSESFFKKWANGTHQSLHKSMLSIEDIKTTSELYERFDKSMENLGLVKPDQKGTISSSRLWDYLQVISVCLAGVMLLTLVYSLLFDVPVWEN